MALTKLDSAMVSIPAKIDKLTSLSLSANNLSADNFTTNTARIFGETFFFGKITALSGLEVVSTDFTTTSALSVEDFFANDVIANNATIENLNNNSLNVAYNTSTVVQNTSGDWNLGYQTGTQYSLNSASLVSAKTVVQNTSGNWNAVYTNVQSNSSKWESLNTIFFNVSADNTTPKYVYFGLGGHDVDSLDGYDIAFNPNAAWTRWFANLGNAAISGINEPFPNSPLYVYPNEIKKVNWSGSAFTILSTYYFTNSQNWDVAYSLVQANSATWEESTEILPTVTNYLSTNSVTISSLNVPGTMIVGNSASTPNEKLTVFGNISATNIVYASGGNSNLWNIAHSLVQANSATWEESTEILPTVTNYLSTSNVNLSSLNVTNRVGIGTTNPNEELTVIGSISAAGNLFFGEDSNILYQSVPNTVTLRVGTSSNQTFFDFQGGSDGVPIIDGQGGGLALATSNTERVRIDNNGNIGINTSTPNERLTVLGNLSATGNIYGGFSIRALADYSDIRLLTTNNRGWRIGHGSTGTTLGNFYIQGTTDNFGSSFVNSIDITNTGNVGVGTTNPNQKLTVSGNISATGNILAPNQALSENGSVVTRRTGDLRYGNTTSAIFTATNVTTSLISQTSALTAAVFAIPLEANSIYDITCNVMLSSNNSPGGSKFAYLYTGQLIQATLNEFYGVQGIVGPSGAGGAANVRALAICTDTNTLSAFPPNITTSGIHMYNRSGVFMTNTAGVLSALYATARMPGSVVPYAGSSIVARRLA